MPQTTYTIDMEPALDGLEYDAAGAQKDRVTYINVVDEIKFGRAVARVSGTNDHCERPDSAGADIVGIALRDTTVPNDAASTDNTYPADSAVGVVKKGRIWCRVEEAVTPADDVFVRHTANGPLTELGIFRTDADTANAIQITAARYLTSADADELAVVEINLP